ncbi:hypothetical protein [Leptospira interrogans]|uniref:hypothetical protein n=1 Tax=Leptospira interrogans TaxID=173 RepID=UPI0030F37B0B
MFYGDFVSNFFSLDSILFALFDILTLFQGRLNKLSIVLFSYIQVVKLNSCIRLMFCNHYKN